MIKSVSCSTECGMAKVNEDWDPSDENSHELTWIYPERLFSCDETDVSLKQDNHKSKKEKEVTNIDEVSPQTMNVKSSRKISMCFGRTGNNQMIAPLFVFGGAKRVQPAWTSDEIHGDVKDADGECIPTQYAANEKGSVDEEMFRETYVAKIIIRTARAQGVRNEDGHRGIFIFDGVQTHISEATMVLLRDNGLIVILRPPNTSSDLQGEDTVIFRQFKPELRKQIATRLFEMNAKDTNAPVKDLTDRDWPPVLLAARKAVINEGIIERSWKHEGVIPFTRAPEKKLRAEEEMKEQRLGKPSNTLSAPTVMVGTDSGPVPIVVPKVTIRAREDLAIAFDSVQKTDVFAENIEALKDKLLKKLQNKEKVLEEEINELGALGMKVAKERDDLMNATEQFIKDGAPIPRASDMWSIADGVNSTQGLAE